MNVDEKWEALRLCTGGSIIAVVAVGAFGPAVGLAGNDATDLIAAAIGFLTMAVLIAKRMI